MIVVTPAIAKKPPGNPRASIAVSNESIQNTRAEGHGWHNVMPVMIQARPLSLEMRASTRCALDDGDAYEAARHHG